MIIKIASRIHGALAGSVLGAAGGAAGGGAISATRQAFKNRKDPENRKSLSDAFLTGAAKGGAAGGIIGAGTGALAQPSVSKSVNKLKDKAKGYYHAGAEQVKQDIEDATGRSVRAAAENKVLGAKDGGKKAAKDVYDNLKGFVGGKK